VTVGKSLVAIHDWTFRLSPGFVVGIGNRLILWLSDLMYRSCLLPRGLAVLGLIAGSVLCAAGTAMPFDVFEPGSHTQVMMAGPEYRNSRSWQASLIRANLAAGTATPG
jgi:hypothetical protein